MSVAPASPTSADPSRRRCVRPRPRLLLAFIAGGLEESVTDETLTAAFLPFGEITDVNLPMDNNARAPQPADDKSDHTPRQHGSQSVAGSP